MYETVCTVEVLPLPHKIATGETPPAVVAVQVMLEAAGTPAQETDNEVEALAIPKDSAKARAIAEMPILRILIYMFYVLILIHTNKFIPLTHAGRNLHVCIPVYDTSGTFSLQLRFKGL